MNTLRWIPLLLFILGTIFKTIGDKKEPYSFGTFIITSIALYSIGFVICIIGLICSLC